MYRIEKIEHSKPRPEWLIHLLMEVKPIYYDVSKSIEDARAKLVQIINIVINSRFLKKNLDVSYEQDCFKVVTKKGYCVVKFKTRRC